MATLNFGSFPVDMSDDSVLYAFLDLLNQEPTSAVAASNEIVATYPDPNDGSTITLHLFGSFSFLFPSGDIDPTSTISGFSIEDSATGLLVSLADLPTPNPTVGFLLTATNEQLEDYADGVPLNITGSSFGDVLTGGSDGDEINGMGGNDTLSAAGGVDKVKGGAGADSVHGGDGNDTVAGNGGDDTVHGDAGADKVWGNRGADTLYGDAGNDTLIGGELADELHGGANRDNLWGQKQSDVLRGDGGNDKLWGSWGNDTLYGGPGRDTLNGGEQADTLDGGSGNDVLNGNAGADVLVFSGANGDDTIKGFEDGLDRINLSAYGVNSTADFSIVEDGADALISGYDGVGNTITVKNTDPADLTDTDFIFI